MRSLACGCNARRGCSLGQLLFRFEEWTKLTRHLEDALGRTHGKSQAEHEAARQKRRREARRAGKVAA